MDKEKVKRAYLVYKKRHRKWIDALNDPNTSSEFREALYARMQRAHARFDRAMVLTKIMDGWQSPAECTDLERRHTREGIVGSNPIPSAKIECEMHDRWTHNDEHDHLYDLSCSLTEFLQHEFGECVSVECGYEDRVGYHFRLHGIGDTLWGKVSDRARDWLSSNTPYRFELQTEEL